MTRPMTSRNAAPLSNMVKAVTTMLLSPASFWVDRTIMTTTASRFYTIRKPCAMRRCRVFPSRLPESSLTRITGLEKVNASATHKAAIGVMPIAHAMTCLMTRVKATWLIRAASATGPRVQILARSGLSPTRINKVMPTVASRSIGSFAFTQLSTERPTRIPTAIKHNQRLSQAHRQYPQPAANSSSKAFSVHISVKIIIYHLCARAR